MKQNIIKSIKTLVNKFKTTTFKPFTRSILLTCYPTRQLNAGSCKIFISYCFIIFEKSNIYKKLILKIIKIEKQLTNPNYVFIIMKL